MVYPSGAIRLAAFVFEAEGGLVVVHPGYADAIDRATAIRPITGKVSQVKGSDQAYQIAAEEGPSPILFVPLDAVPEKTDSNTIAHANRLIYEWVMGLPGPIADERAEVFSRYFLVH